MCCAVLDPAFFNAVLGGPCQDPDFVGEFTRWAHKEDNQVYIMWEDRPGVLPKNLVSVYTFHLAYVVAHTQCACDHRDASVRDGALVLISLLD